MHTTRSEKMGLSHEDMHLRKADGRYQASPPKELRTLYDYLPTDDSPLSAQYKVPTKVSLEGAINSLRQQSHCLGTCESARPSIQPIAQKDARVRC